MKNFDNFYIEETYYKSGYNKGVENLINDTNMPRGNALDIGAGQGRNTFMLHDKGFCVYAVEPSLEGCNTISKVSEFLKKPIEVVNSKFLDFDEKGKKFNLVIAITSLDHMSLSDVKKSVKKIKDMLNDNGYVYITCFMEGDQGNINRKSFASETSIFIKHYFKHNELKELFKDFMIIKYEEIHSVDLSHGPRHYHNTALLVAQKTKTLQSDYENEDEKFMKMAIEISKTSKEPYGAIIVKNHKIIGSSKNVEPKNILEHAEYRAIVDALNKHGSDLNGAVIYTSCEPCVCCYGAIFNTSISKVVFAATLEDSQKYFYNENIIKAKEINKFAERPLKVVEELYRDKAVEVLKAKKKN